METNEQYLKYEEYKALGGKLDLTSFNLLEFEARRKIDIKTFNRLKIDNIPKEVKLCEFNMINSLDNYSKAVNSISNSQNIKSENIDGYSVTYGTLTDVSEIVKSKNKELDDIIRTYLLNVIYDGEHLMYCGVDNVSK